MFDEIFAFEVVELVLLKVKLMGQADYFQSTQEEAEKSLIEDLFILGEFILHNGVDEEDDAFFKHLLLVTKVVLVRKSWTCVVGGLTDLSGLDKLGGVELRAKLSSIESLG